MHGWGTKEFVSGDCYVGQFEQNMQQGHGLYTWPNGNFYIGSFEQGQMTGWGIKDMNGDVYTGEWKDGQASGVGRKVFMALDSHEGCYLNDLRHGYGVYRWNQGDVYAGFWAAGRQEGWGTYTHYNGHVFQGQWSEGQKHGTGVLTSGTETWKETWERGICTKQERINLVPTRFLQTTSLPEYKQQYEALQQDISYARQELERLQNQVVTISARSDASVCVCIACMERPRSCVLRPCAHIALCSSCAQRVHRCPVCRTDIENTQLVFMA